MTEEEKVFEITVEREEDYRFNIDFQLNGVPKLFVDEDPPVGKGEGPDPSRLLGAAIAHCMISSFLFCMGKSRANVRDVKGIVKIRFGRNENGRLRISRIDLSIDADVPEKDRQKMERCKTIFEDFCAVSQSVKSGIPIGFDFIKSGSN